LPAERFLWFPLHALPLEGGDGTSPRRKGWDLLLRRRDTLTTEEGIVIKIDAHGTWVKTVKTGACAGCSARGSCHAQSGGEEMEVNVLNDIGAKVGDRIVLGIETASLLRASFLLYLFPILALMAGAFAGNGLAALFAADVSASAAGAGLLCFVLAVLFMRRRADRMAARKSYRPRIIRILSRPSAAED